MKALAIQLLNLQKLFLMMIMMMMMMKKKKKKMVMMILMMMKMIKKKMMMIILMVTTMTTSTKTRTSHTDQNVLENNSSVLNPVILIKVYSTRYISVI